MKKLKSLRLQLPIWVLLGYLLMTLLLYAIGPFKWYTPRPVAFWLLQAAYLAALFLGWQVGLGKTRTTKEWNIQWDNVILKWLPGLLVVGILIEVINLFRKFGYDTPDFVRLIKDIIWGLKNPGAAYGYYQNTVLKMSASELFGGRVMTVINYVWYFASYVVLLLSTYYFKRLNILGKCLLVLEYGLILVSYLAIGTNIGVFRLILAILTFAVLWFIRNVIRMDKKRRRKVITILLVAILVAAIGMLFVFDMMMKSRGGILQWDSDEYNVGGFGLNRDSVIFKILPESLYMTAISASSYLTQGYQGMSIALILDWKPTFGVGHNMWLIGLLDPSGQGITTDTYQYRMEYWCNWKMGVQWHTMYTWWANDLSFIGTILIMFVFGILFAMAYKDCLESKNPFAALMVFFFALQAFFIPCNNQLFQSAVIVIGFYVTMVLWLVSRGTIRLGWIKRFFEVKFGGKKQQK